MGIQFFERMSGELVDDAGRPHHVAIDLRCDATDLKRFVSNGTVRAVGTVRARPWVDGAACTGTVLLRPYPGGRIEYDVTFTGPDERSWRLFGRKDPSVRRPLRSMSTMASRLERDGEQIAAGTMRFSFDDLPSFAASWRPRAAARPAAVAGDPAEWAGSPVLREADLRTLRALAEATISPDGVVPPVDDETLASAEELLRRMPPFVFWGYRAGLLGLDAAAMSRHGRQFARLDLPRRRALLDRLAGAGGDSVVFALQAPIKMAHFSRRSYLDAVGLPDYSVPAAGPAPRWLQAVTPPEELEHRTHVECDVVVIGTGAGGGPVAATLAERGLTVVMVEEGRYAQRADYARGPEERMLAYYRDAGMNVALGNSAFSVPTGRMVGGTTAINSGTCFRTPDAVLADWRAAGFPAAFSPGRFGGWLDRAERELQVAAGDPRYLGRIGRVVAKGVAEMGGQHGPLRRNAPGCDGQGLCFVGCPTDAKLGSDQTWVPRALRAGARLFTGLPVTRLLLSGGRATGVLAEGQDRFGAPRRLEIRARAVVLAAGSLVTPVMLRNNGIALPWVGRNLSIHPALTALAMFPDADGEPWRAIPQGYGAEGLGDERIRFEGGYMPPQLAAAAMPFDGPELSRWMSAWQQVEQFGFMTRDTGVGSVIPGPGGRSLLRYSVTPRVLQSFQCGSAALAELLLRGGATEVATRIAGVGTVRSIAEAREIPQLARSPRQFTGMGFHPLGTARMGTGPDTAVVDFDNRVFGVRDLYVADGSVVPSSLGVNPMITIMAMALRAADTIADDLDGRDRLARPRTTIVLDRALPVGV